MPPIYSIAAARDRFAALVRDAETSQQAIKITRRGRTVAVILSAEAYARLQANQKERNFGEAYAEWRQKWLPAGLDLDPEEIWENVRDQTPPASESPWD